MINTTVELNNVRKSEVEVKNKKAFDKVVEICSALFAGKDVSKYGKDVDAVVSKMASLGEAASNGDTKAVAEINTVVKFIIQPKLLEATKVYNFLGNYHELAYNELPKVKTYSYEGIDSRIEKYVDQNISIGDYILTGGELASMVVMDGIMRLLDEGISSDSLKEESYNSSLLEYPQYTRPVEYDGQRVPDVLMSGNHEKIRQYNLKESLRETLKYRPDLLKNKELNKEEQKFLEEIKNEINSCL